MHGLTNVDTFLYLVVTEGVYGRRAIVQLPLNAVSSNDLKRPRAIQSLLKGDSRIYQFITICDRLRENQAYWIDVQLAQCAFLVLLVKNCQSSDFVIST